MAYISSERKAQLAPAIKAVCDRYKIKATLSVRHHSTLVLTIREGKINFLENASPNEKKLGHAQINVYWFKDHYSGLALKFLTDVRDAMTVGNHDRSDLMSDYHDVGWYIDIHVGKWDKPYKLVD